MSITGHSSFVPTVNEFLAHWLQTNTFLGAGGPLVLSDGSTIVILTGYRDSLLTFGSSIQGKLNDVEIDLRARQAHLECQRQPESVGVFAAVLRRPERLDQRRVRDQ